MGTIPTALIAPSDDTAAKAWHWLAAAGVRIPEDMSLISFDNYPTMPPPPITTIDFGFGNLGYAALHLLLGDVPVKRGRDGTVRTVPTVVRRGSVGRPRAGRLPVSLRGARYLSE
jgi:DNA-binding LacI/PurR family transcriptional regulator